MYSLKKLTFRFLVILLLVGCNKKEKDTEVKSQRTQEFDKKLVSRHNTEFQYERLKLSKLGSIGIDTTTIILEEIYSLNPLLEYKFDPQTNEIITVKRKSREKITKPIHNLELYKRLKEMYNFDDRAILYILDQREKDEQLKNIEYLESSINSLEDEIFSLSEK